MHEKNRTLHLADHVDICKGYAIKTSRKKNREHLYVRDAPGSTGKRRYKQQASDRCGERLCGE
jgi:hypothetical protein